MSEVTLDSQIVLKQTRLSKLWQTLAFSIAELGDTYLGEFAYTRQVNKH